MEILINHTHLSFESYYMFLIAICTVWIFFGIILLLKWLFSDNPQKKLIIFSAVLITVFFIVAASEFYIFDFDFGTNNIITANDKIVEHDSNRINYLLFSEEGSKYKLFRSDEDDYIEKIDYFIGKDCEIEYYKFSKYIIRIKVIE